MDLQSIITRVAQGQLRYTIVQKTGLGVEQVDQAIALGLPMILGGLARNTAQPDGAKALDDALTRDHLDSEIVDQPGLATTDSATEDGEKIVSHVFGSQSDNILDEIASKVGTDRQTMLRMMAVLAPIVLAYLGRQKKDANLDADGVKDTLQQQKSADGNLLGDIFGAVVGMLGKK